MSRVALYPSRLGLGSFPRRKEVPSGGKRQWVVTGANAGPSVTGVGDLPIVTVSINDVPIQALIDTGCTTTLLSPHFKQIKDLKEYSNWSIDSKVSSFNGNPVRALGRVNVSVSVLGSRSRMMALVMESLVGGIVGDRRNGRVVPDAAG